MTEAKREIVIRMLDDGNDGYIVAWPEHKSTTESKRNFSPRHYAMTNIEDLVNFLQEKLKGELSPDMGACHEGR